MKSASNRTALAEIPSLNSGAQARGVGRMLLWLAGWLALVLGMVGVILPLLPTAPFLVVALMCFARSDPAMLERMFRMPLIGRYLRDWQEGRGVSRGLKWTALAALWATALWSMVVLAKTLTWKLLIALLVVASSIHLLSMPVTAKRSRKARRSC